jgi:hypothetical protein
VGALMLSKIPLAFPLLGSLASICSQKLVNQNLEVKSANGAQNQNDNSLIEQPKHSAQTEKEDTFSGAEKPIGTADVLDENEVVKHWAVFSFTCFAMLSTNTVTRKIEPQSGQTKKEGLGDAN